MSLFCSFLGVFIDPRLAKTCKAACIQAFTCLHGEQRLSDVSWQNLSTSQGPCADRTSSSSVRAVASSARTHSSSACSSPRRLSAAAMSSRAVCSSYGGVPWSPRHRLEDAAGVCAAMPARASRTLMCTTASQCMQCLMQLKLPGYQHAYTAHAITSTSADNQKMIAVTWPIARLAEDVCQLKRNLSK